MCGTQCCEDDYPVWSFYRRFPVYRLWDIFVGISGSAPVFQSGAVYQSGNAVIRLSCLEDLSVSGKLSGTVDGGLLCFIFRSGRTHFSEPYPESGEQSVLEAGVSSGKPPIPPEIFPESVRMGRQERNALRGEPFCTCADTGCGAVGLPAAEGINIHVTGELLPGDDAGTSGV